MYYRCYICHKPPRGFCWLDPNRFQSSENRRASFKRFCSKTCQDIHYQLHRKGVDVNSVSPAHPCARDISASRHVTDLEQKAAESVLASLADYVMAVGMEKGLGSYSKDEIIGLVDTVLESYHCTLQELYKDEVPF